MSKPFDAEAASMDCCDLIGDVWPKLSGMTVGQAEAVLYIPIVKTIRAAYRAGLKRAEEIARNIPDGRWVNFQIADAIAREAEGRDE